MLSPLNRPAIFAVTVFLLPVARSQGFLISALPSCIRDCINASDSGCAVSDIGCLCRASSGSFLPDMVTCMHDNCIDIDTDVLLAPLEFACNLAGASIPDSAKNDAENQESSLKEVTKTVTVGTSTEKTTTTVRVTTTEDGETQTLLYPVIIEKTTTVTGEPSTITRVSTKDGSTVVSTYTTTDSDGSTVTEKSTYTTTVSADDSSSISTDSNDESSSRSGTTKFTTTTVAVQGTVVTSTDSSGTSQTSAAPPASETDSAPFTDTNNSTAGKAEIGNLLGFSVLLLFGCVLF